MFVLAWIIWDVTYVITGYVNAAKLLAFEILATCDMPSTVRNMTICSWEWWSRMAWCSWIRIIHIKNPTRCHSVSKFYFIFIWSSTCFRRHTAHRQEPKTAPVASGFAHVEGCRSCSCWALIASSNYTTNNPPRMKNQRLLVQFLDSWWWAVCRPKHVELHINLK